MNKITENSNDNKAVSNPTPTVNDNITDSNIKTQNRKVIDEDVPNRDVGLENNYAFHDDNDKFGDVCRENSSLPEYDDEEGISYEEAEESYGGGIRERSLLCPILEEDGESTASTSSLIASSLSGASSRVS